MSTEQKPEAPAVPGVTRWRRKPSEFEAYQWHENGDHPADDCRMIIPDRPGTTEPFWSEGEIVRYYRNPDDDGQRECGDCGVRMHDHGWIDQSALGRVVCPGDFVVSLPLPTPGLTAYFPVKPDTFAAISEPAPGPPVMPQDDEATRMLTDFMGLPEPSLRPAEPVAGSRETAGGLPVAAALDRAERAEAKLAALTAYLREHSGDAGLSRMHAWDLLALVGAEGEAPSAPVQRAVTTVSLECGHEGWIYSDETACKFAWCGTCKKLRTFVPAREVGTEGDDRGSRS